MKSMINYGLGVIILFIITLLVGTITLTLTILQILK